MIRIYKDKSKKRSTRVRAKLKKVSQRIRLSVFRSNKHIYAQIIDDTKGKTLVVASDYDIKSENKSKKSKKEETGKAKKLNKYHEVGQALAKKAKAKKISKVYFDRGKYKYHGNIKDLAKGAREGGLEF
ncbi:50S ribosomal protein L18 [Patescibacteria group bacterium]